MSEFDISESHPEEDDGESWLATYADAITLLMAFFVILLARSQGGLPTNQEQVEAAEEVAAQEKDAEERGEALQTMKEAIESMAKTHAVEDAIDVTQNNESVIIEMADKGFFATGSWRLKPKARVILRSLAQVIETTELNYPYQLEVQGHTDDVPNRKRGRNSNWELSSRRATHVLKMLVKGGIKEENLKAVGYAHTRPKRPNRDTTGKPIPQNRSANRRVVLLLEVEKRDKKTVNQVL
ncbi:MAG: flagellar motor protein MotB [Myxococcota bacterium]|nr:flagellar motor protein MotB [Myxococcota bacterium]